jgi:DNA-binding MarR family transcriptional regulator
MEEKQDFIRHYRENQLNFTRFYSTMLSMADLTMPQYALLVQLLELKRSSMTDLSKRLYISKPAITNLVDRLEEKKLLKRLPHPTDRRISLVQIELIGERLVHDIQAKILKLLLNTLDQFSQKDRHTITRFYGELACALTASLEKKK